MNGSLWWEETAAVGFFAYSVLCGCYEMLSVGASGKWLRRDVKGFFLFYCYLRRFSAPILSETTTGGAHFLIIMRTILNSVL